MASLTFNPGNFVGREEIDLRENHCLCPDAASAEPALQRKVWSMMGSHESSGGTSLIDFMRRSLRGPSWISRFNRLVPPECGGPLLVSAG